MEITTTTTTENTQRQLALSVSHENTNSLISFKKFAENNGLNLDDKQEKKKANVLYTQCKKAYYAEGKAWAAFLNSQADMNVHRYAVKRDDEGNIVRANINFKATSKAESKANRKAEVEQVVEEQKQKIAELEAKLAAYEAK